MATAQHCCNIQWGPWPEHWATLYMASCPNRQCCKPFRSSTTAFVISGSRANSPPSPCNVSPQRLPSPRRKPCSSAVPDRIGHTTIAQAPGYRRRGCKDPENCYYQQPVSPARNQGPARQPGSQPGIDLIGCSTTYDQPRQGLAAISSCSGRAPLLRARRCSASVFLTPAAAHLWITQCRWRRDGNPAAARRLRLQLVGLPHRVACAASSEHIRPRTDTIHRGAREWM